MNINKATDTSLSGAITTIANEGLKVNVAVPYTTLIAVVIAIVVTVTAGYALRYGFSKIK